MKKLFLLLSLMLAFNSFAQLDMTADELALEQQILEEQLIDADPSTRDFEELKKEYLALDSRKAKRQYRRQFDKETKRRLKRQDREWSGPRLVCVYGQAGAVIDGIGMRCTNFRGEKYHIAAIGIGYNFNMATGVAIVRTKKDDIEGDYTFTNGALYLGLGFTKGTHIKTSNPDAEPQVKLFGLGLGIGMNFSIQKLFIERL